MGHTGFGDQQIPEKVNNKCYFNKCGEDMKDAGSVVQPEGQLTHYPKFTNWESIQHFLMIQCVFLYNNNNIYLKSNIQCI